jgi:hypothetical protein
MARAAMKYAFAALLALLSTQAVVISARAGAAIEIVCSKQTRRTDERQTPREVRRDRAEVRAPQSAPAYVSWIMPEPDTAVLFQRPPPLSSFFS